MSWNRKGGTVISIEIEAIGYEVNINVCEEIYLTFCKSMCKEIDEKSILSEYAKIFFIKRRGQIVAHFLTIMEEFLPICLPRFAIHLSHSNYNQWGNG